VGFSCTTGTCWAGSFEPPVEEQRPKQEGTGPTRYALGASETRPKLIAWGDDTPTVPVLDCTLRSDRLAAGDTIRVRTDGYAYCEGAPVELGPWTAVAPVDLLGPFEGFSLF
jgi:hypothetical protein